MPEEIIKSQIRKSVNSDLLWGAGAIALGVVVSLIAWQLGYVVYFFAIIPLVGVYMLAKGAYQFISWKSHKVYENWELYDKNEKIPSSILAIINERNPKSDFGSLIISNEWLVFPESFNFLKYNDINWVYLNRENSRKKNESPEILVHTRFGKIFEASVGDFSYNGADSKEQAILLFYSELIKKSPSVAVGFNKEFKKSWKRDAGGFAAYAKSHSHVNEKVAK